jgi:hypothetical protein
MAFVVMHDNDDFRKWISCSLDLGCGHTTLQGKDGRMVLAVPDFAVEEMESRGIACTPIPEARLPEYLSAGGFNYYRLLQKANRGSLYFDAPLPPANHVKLFCTICEPHLEALRQIVERHDPVEFRTREVSIEVISAQADASSESHPMVRVEFTVPRKHRQKLIEELIASGTAGTNRITAIYTESDPDGPPASAPERR